MKLNTVPDSFGLDDARGWYVYLTKCELAIASSPPGPPPLPPLVAAGLTSAPVVSLPGNSTPLTPGLAFLTVPFFLNEWPWGLQSLVSFQISQCFGGAAR